MNLTNFGLEERSSAKEASVSVAADRYTPTHSGKRTGGKMKLNDLGRPKFYRQYSVRGDCKGVANELYP